jgi:Spy/CpxP family protein refolding chaperone
MKRKAVAPIALIFLVPLFAEISAAGGSRHSGYSRSGHFARSFSSSGGAHASFGGHGSRLNLGSRHIHPHHFGHRTGFHHKKVFGPSHHFGHHHVVIPHHGFHGGFFFGHRVIGVPPSSVVVWSHAGTMRSGFTAPPPEPMIGERVFERPLITMMLRNRQELGLSSEQVQDLENLRDGYQREAIRYQADIRIAEVELQSLLKADAVDLERVKVKLQEIEHLTTELRLARIRAIGQGKALLSSEQHEKLQALLGGSRYSRLGDEQFSEPTEDQP